MKHSWQIITLLLAVALLFLTIKVTMTNNKTPQETTLDTKQIGIDLIMSRSSVRSYTEQVPDATTIETILKAGMAAPTAGNRQPWEFVVINDRGILDSIAVIIPGAAMAKKAQVAIAVCGVPSEALIPDYWIQDCSAATENILLAAHSLGLGAVWCGAYPNNESDKVGKLQKLLSLDEGVYTLSIVVLGYPNSVANVKDKWKPNKVSYK